MYCIRCKINYQTKKGNIKSTDVITFTFGVNALLEEQDCVCKEVQLKRMDSYCEEYFNRVLKKYYRGVYYSCEVL